MVTGLACLLIGTRNNHCLQICAHLLLFSATLTVLDTLASLLFSEEKHITFVVASGPLQFSSPCGCFFLPSVQPNRCSCSTASKRLFLTTYLKGLSVILHPHYPDLFYLIFYITLLNWFISCPSYNLSSVKARGAEWFFWGTLEW